MNLDLFCIRYVATHLVTGPDGRLGLEQAHGKVVMTRGLRESYTPLVHAQHPTAPAPFARFEHVTRMAPRQGVSGV